MKPAIRLKGTNLYINQHIVSLRTRTKTLLLVKAMLAENGERAMDRESLRSHVYDCPEEPSERLRISQDSSLNKLISRSRTFLAESLRDSDLSRSIDWFVYCNRERTWRLFEMGGSRPGGARKMSQFRRKPPSANPDQAENFA
jgi:hypothetical protein